MRLIACGGTGLTLHGVKDSTKDIDLMVPDEGEHDYLLSILKQFGYKQVTGSGWARGGGFVFDLFRGNRIHTRLKWTGYVIAIEKQPSMTWPRIGF
ncbi:MAG: hypothetical protein P8123_09365 [bacterium]